MIEIENPCVGGSIPPQATSTKGCDQKCDQVPLGNAIKSQPFSISAVLGYASKYSTSTPVLVTKTSKEVDSQE